MSKLIPCINGHEDGEDGDGECFNLSVRLKYDHNHEISSTDAWNFLDVSKETKERFFQLFSDAFSPAKARLAYIAEMKAKLGESEWFKISAKRSVNPDSGTVSNLYTLFCKRFGSVNGPDAFLKAAELIERINEKAGERIASIRQLDDKSKTIVVFFTYILKQDIRLTEKTENSSQRSSKKVKVIYLFPQRGEVNTMHL